MNEAMRDWVTNVRDTYYCIGSVMGPHPYPTIVRDFQRVIGDRGARTDPGGAKGACPTRSSRASAAARTRSASSTPFLEDADVRSDRRRGGGRGPRDAAARRGAHRRPPGVLHGSSARSCCRTRTGRSSWRTRSRRASTTPASARSTRSSATAGRAEYAAVTDDEALDAFRWLVDAPRASSPRSSRRTRSPQVRKLAPRARAARDR